MYCTNCGERIDAKAVLCPHCGVAQNPAQLNDDTGGVAWGILAFFVPVVGLILYLVWKDTKPTAARAAAIGALIHLALITSFLVLYFFFIVLVLGVVVGSV